MKRMKFIYAIFFLAIMSCSQYTENEDTYEHVPIRFSLNDIQYTTKADISTDSDFVAQVMASEKSFSGLLAWDDLYVDFRGITFDLPVRFVSGQGTILGPEMYFPLTSLDFSAFYPAENIDEPDLDKEGLVVERKGKYVYYNNFKGNYDILCTNGPRVHWPRTDEPVELSFDHALSKVTFMVRAENQETADIWGKITRLELTDMKDTIKLDLDGMNVTPVGREYTEYVAYDNNQGQILTTEAAGLRVDGQNVDGNNGVLYVYKMEDMYLRVYTTNFPDGKDVTILNPSEILFNITNPGESYEVTLTFKSQGISCSSTLAPWVDGGSDEVNVR